MQDGKLVKKLKEKLGKMTNPYEKKYYEGPITIINYLLNLSPINTPIKDLMLIVYTVI